MMPSLLYRVAAVTCVVGLKTIELGDSILIIVIVATIQQVDPVFCVGVVFCAVNVTNNLSDA